jgi:hypothetical protein
MAQAQLHVVDVPGAIELSREQVAMSHGGFAALDLAVPEDFTRPGARAQVLLSDGHSHAFAPWPRFSPNVDPDPAMVATGDADRRFAGEVPSESVTATV